MSAQEASQQDGTTEKDGMKDARMVKQWSAWGILLAVVLVAVGWLWWAPVGVTIAATDATVQCEPLIGAHPRDVDVLLYLNEVQDALRAANADDLADGPSRALSVVLSACDVERENRAIALTLTAIAGGTALILLRPRRRAAA